MSDGQTPEELEADIERQREQLATTVDQLTAKLDVKSQAQAKVADVKSQAKVKVADVKSQAKVKVVEAKESATTDDGKPRPEVLAVAGAIVGAALLFIWWRRR
jgi:F0F1-type ATP synthase membrane subunit b/b'